MLTTTVRKNSHSPCGGLAHLWEGLGAPLNEFVAIQLGYLHVFVMALGFGFSVIVPRTQHLEPGQLYGLKQPK
jgi:hypothetical protein